MKLYINGHTWHTDKISSASPVRIAEFQLALSSLNFIDKLVDIFGRIDVLPSDRMKTLIVTGLDKLLSCEEVFHLLTNLISKPIVKVKLIDDFVLPGLSQGVCVVEFGSYQDAKFALALLNKKYSATFSSKNTNELLMSYAKMFEVSHIIGLNNQNVILSIKTSLDSLFIGNSVKRIRVYSTSLIVEFASVLDSLKISKLKEFFESGFGFLSPMIGGITINPIMKASSNPENKYKDKPKLLPQLLREDDKSLLLSTFSDNSSKLFEMKSKAELALAKLAENQEKEKLLKKRARIDEEEKRHNLKESKKSESEDRKRRNMDSHKFSDESPPRKPKQQSAGTTITKADPNQLNNNNLLGLLSFLMAQNNNKNPVNQQLFNSFSSMNSEDIAKNLQLISLLSNLNKQPNNEAINNTIGASILEQLASKSISNVPSIPPQVSTPKPNISEKINSSPNNYHSNYNYSSKEPKPTSSRSSEYIGSNNPLHVSLPNNISHNEKYFPYSSHGNYQHRPPYYHEPTSNPYEINSQSTHKQQQNMGYYHQMDEPILGGNQDMYMPSINPPLNHYFQNPQQINIPDHYSGIQQPHDIPKYNNYDYIKKGNDFPSHPYQK